MTIARRKQLCLDVTPFYHCITRCVRRAFLCGRDRLTGRNLNHRRQWIENHLLLLSNAFCIDVAAYAIMSNHYHVVLHVNQKRATDLSEQEVISRWHKLYKGPDLIKRYVANEPLTDRELETVRRTIKLWRKELTNISRFMAHLNETIARRANREDKCKGCFWESRFKLQAILDLKALLRTLCYVDLNPVRARVSQSPETSNFTSFKRRLDRKPSGLMEFAATTESPDPNCCQFSIIPIGFRDYRALVDFTSKIVSTNARDTLSTQAPVILDKLGYQVNSWRSSLQKNVGWMQRALGNSEAVSKYCSAIGQKWIWQTTS